MFDCPTLIAVGPASAASGCQDYVRATCTYIPEVPQSGIATVCN